MTMLAEMNLPYAYDHFVEEESSDPPFLVFLYPGSNHFAAELVRDSLFLKCYDRENGRFFQGIKGGVSDKAWALDCTTWAGTLICSVVHSSTAEACLETAGNVYLTQNKKIIQSRENK